MVEITKNNIIKELGLKDKDKARLRDKGIWLPGEDARQLGLKCRDCGSKKVVYYISIPFGTLFPEGAYCYKCLLKRCQAAMMIPFPIEENLLNNLKVGMGLRINTPPRVIKPKGV